MLQKHVNVKYILLNIHKKPLKNNNFTIRDITRIRKWNTKQRLR